MLAVCILISSSRRGACLSLPLPLLDTSPWLALRPSTLAVHPTHPTPAPSRSGPSGRPLHGLAASRGEGPLDFKVRDGVQPCQGNRGNLCLRSTISNSLGQWEATRDAGASLGKHAHRGRKPTSHVRGAVRSAPDPCSAVTGCGTRDMSPSGASAPCPHNWQNPLSRGSPNGDTDCMHQMRPKLGGGGGGGGRQRVNCWAGLTVRTEPRSCAV